MSSHTPRRTDLPDLPRQCDEIRATANPGSPTRLEKYVDDLPGLNTDRFDLLANIACTAKGGRYGCTGPGATVLDINDVLQMQRNEAIGLHPRITHVLPVEKLDAFHRAVTDLLDGDIIRNGYQYPSHVLEYRVPPVDETLLYPPEYDKRIADIAGSLRADGVLTSIRRPGQSQPDPDEFRTAVDEMDTAGEKVTGAITLYQPEGESEPTVFVYDHNTCTTEFSIDELVDHCIFLFHRHDICLDIVPAGESYS